VRVLGIDPGISVTGFGVIEGGGDGVDRILKWGCIRTDSAQSLGLRIKHIYDEICSLIQTYKPDCLAVEEVYFARNVKSALKVGQVLGVTLLAGAHFFIETFKYTPLQVKQGITGYGWAEKSQVQEILRRIFKLNDVPRPDHAADAIATAVCHLHSIKVLCQH
jgi:crossover junction endodeoxyribonuclease RuvC